MHHIFYISIAQVNNAVEVVLNYFYLGQIIDNSGNKLEIKMECIWANVCHFEIKNVTLFEIKDL